MEPNLILIGLVVGLDYENPHFNPYQEFQRFKTHPMVKDIHCTKFLKKTVFDRVQIYSAEELAYRMEQEQSMKVASKQCLNVSYDSYSQAQASDDFDYSAVTFPGGALVGCAAGFVNVPKIKGIHNAMKTGMLAAEDAVKLLDDADAGLLQLIIAMIT